MLVFGDRSRAQETAEKLAQVEDGLRAAAASGPGIGRHGALVTAFLAAGELAQGLADVEFGAKGVDAPSPVRDASAALCLALAHQIRASWRSGFTAAVETVEPEIAALAGLPLSAEIRTKPAEGHAFYAVYPEAYLEAAERASRGPRPMQVVGLRSIGSGLGAMVAAGLGAETAISLRPTGDPFRRRLALAPELADTLAGASEGWAVVDEGPGLSGSSFAAVADVLEAGGAAPEDIHLFPSHFGDPGPFADPALRERWVKWPRHVVDFDTLALAAADPAHRLETWAAELVGPAMEPLVDLSAGAWRERLYADEAQWPPVFAGQERRKFLMTTADGPWLLKFAGLGVEGERKKVRAEVLSDAGFIPRTAGLAHGFLVQRWLEDARPLDPRRCDRQALVDHVGRYLCFRASRFPARHGSGAAPKALWTMARANIAEAGGDVAAVEAWAPRLADIGRRLFPIEVDGRMHAWEWLQAPDGRLYKADALDHACAHDLVGRQDVAWDIAGAEVELDLDPAERRHLIERVRQARPVDEDIVAFMTVCYRAFQLGRSALAATGAPAGEAARLARAQQRYLTGPHAARAA